MKYTNPQALHRCFKDLAIGFMENLYLHGICGQLLDLRMLIQVSKRGKRLGFNGRPSREMPERTRVFRNYFNVFLCDHIPSASGDWLFPPSITLNLPFSCISALISFGCSFSSFSSSFNAIYSIIDERIFRYASIDICALFPLLCSEVLQEIGRASCRERV